MRRCRPDGRVGHLERMPRRGRLGLAAHRRLVGPWIVVALTCHSVECRALGRIGQGQSVIGSLGLAISALRRGPDIRRAEVAWMLGYAAEWAWLVALFVYAYGVGGVAAVGLAGLVRTLPAACWRRLSRRWPIACRAIGSC